MDIVDIVYDLSISWSIGLCVWPKLDMEWDLEDLLVPLIRTWTLVIGLCSTWSFFVLVIFYCKNGFHSCHYPMETCWFHYPLLILGHNTHTRLSLRLLYNETLYFLHYPLCFSCIPLPILVYFFPRFPLFCYCLLANLRS